MSTAMVCITCGMNYRKIQTGVNVLETRRLALSDSAETPYKLWSADLFECPGCHHQIVAGMADYPYAQEGTPGFELLVAKVISDPSRLVFPWNERYHANAEERMP